MLKNKTKYALRAIQAIAREANSVPVTTTELARKTKISHKFLEQILFEMKQAGFLTSRKGSKGGYLLARPAEKISLGAIIRIMEGPIALVPCVSQKLGEAPCDDCSDPLTCGFRVVFRQVRNETAHILDSKSIRDVLKIESELRQTQILPSDYQI